MNDLQLLLAVSPGGTDAITGVMAKAPPGESPPVNAGTFLQLLLQTLPGVQSDGPRTDLLTALRREAECVELKSETEEGLPPADGTTPPEQGSSAAGMSALQLAALAVAFPGAVLAEPELLTETVEPEPDATMVAPAVRRPGTSQLAAALTELTDGEMLSLPVPARTELSRTPEADDAEARPVQMNAEIPAPETREGSAKTERPLLFETAKPAATPRATATPLVKEAGDVPPEPTAATGPRQKVPKEGLREPGVEMAASREPLQPTVTRPRSFGLDAELGEDLAAARPAVVPREIGKPRASMAEKAAAPDASPTPAAPQEPQTPERPQLRVSGSRHAEREQEPDLDPRGAPTGKASGRMVLVDLPVMPDAPEKPAQPVDRPSKGGERQAVEGVETGPEPGNAQPAHAGAASTPREPSEPIAGRQSPGGVQGHAVKETGSEAVREGHGPSGKMHVRLTEELSRSVLDQVVKHVALQVRGGTSEMRIRLDPPSLGEMQVTVRVEEGRVQAQIDVAQPAVRIALETNVPQLRQTLADHGIEVHRIEVCASGSSMSRESNEGHGHRPRKRDGGRQQGPLDGVEQYRGARMMGYNTIEMVM